MYLEGLVFNYSDKSLADVGLVFLNGGYIELLEGDKEGCLPSLEQVRTFSLCLHIQNNGPDHLVNGHPLILHPYHFNQTNTFSLRNALHLDHGA